MKIQSQTMQLGIYNCIKSIVLKNIVKVEENILGCVDV